MTVLFTVDALDASNVATTLRFSDGKYIDGSGHYYDPCIADAPEISVIANDGGLFEMFGDSSIGDVSLNNLDGALDYVADYAVDGRVATVSFFDGVTVTERWRGAASRMSEKSGQVIFSLKSFQETLGNQHPMASYVGDNVPPAGLEGT